MKALDEDQKAVRDLARQADPLDVLARVIARGFRVLWPCTKCGGTGTVRCSRSDHGHRSVAAHPCDERACDDARCAAMRQSLLMASVEAHRIRHEEGR